MFRLIAGQSSSVLSRGCTMYLKFATTSTSAPPSPPYSMNSISLHLSDISTSLYLSRIYVDLLNISVYIYLISLAAGTFISHWLHLVSGSGPYCRTSTFDFQYQYMDCYLIPPGLFALSGNPSTGHKTDFSTRGKYTLYVSVPPSPTSTPLFYGKTIPCVLSICWRREDASTTPPPPPELLKTYPDYLPLLKSAPFSRRYPLVHRCYLLSPNEPRGAHHWFGIAKVCQDSHPFEHPYHICQSCLHPGGIAPRYSAVVWIERNVMITLRPAKSVVFILSSAAFQ